MKRDLEKAGEQELFLAEMNSLKKESMDSNQEENNSLDEEHKFEMLT